jgi:aspartate/methionine/tyrosine aminotransferase
MELALELPDVIRLEIGDPDFATPEHVVAAAAEAARAGFTHYSPGIGLSSLRELIAEKVRERNGLSCAPDQVVVTTGACGAIHAGLLALLDPGDELLVPDPGWTTLVPMALAAGVVPVPYPLDRSRAFAFDPDALAARVGLRTRAVVVNTPCNPTGTTASRQQLEAVVELAERHGLWIISDECYEELVLDGAHVSTAALGDPDRIVSVFSFSKTYAMTGWRIGYAVASAPIARLLARAQEPVVSSASTIAQKAAEAALTGPQDVVAVMRETYRCRRDRALAILDQKQVDYVRPEAAFYLLVDVTRAGMPAPEFARRLLLDQRVAVVPGDAFGSGTVGMIRVSLAASDDDVAEGVARLARAVVKEVAAAS